MEQVFVASDGILATLDYVDIASDVVDVTSYLVLVSIDVVKIA